MAFMYNNRDLPYLDNYEEALCFWTNAKKWRDSPDRERQLDGASKRHVTISKDHNDAIRCRYHFTDVVVYHSDGTIDVDAHYASRSSDAFIRGLIYGAGLEVWTNSVEHPVAWVRGTGYLVKGSTASFERTPDGYRLINPAPITTYAVKKDVTKQLREQYQYKKYQNWSKMTTLLVGQPDYGWESRRNPSHRPNSLSKAKATELLQLGVEAWDELRIKCSDDYVLQSIYRMHPECIATRERQPFESITDFSSWKALDARYGWALKGY